MPVAMTKSSGLSCWSMRHMASTYSPAQPQSRTTSVLPRLRRSPEPAAMRAAVDTILRVTKREGRMGDSWLVRMPEQA